MKVARYATGADRDVRWRMVDVEIEVVRAYCRSGECYEQLKAMGLESRRDTGDKYYALRMRQALKVLLSRRFPTLNFLVTLPARWTVDPLGRWQIIVQPKPNH